jgi:hypothetical protein
VSPLVFRWVTRYLPLGTRWESADAAASAGDSARHVRFVHPQSGELGPGAQLEERGWIDATWGGSDNNRQAEFYSLTKRGRTRLNVETENYRRYAAAVFAALEAQPSSGG